jgi:hypothetical protein
LLGQIRGLEKIHNTNDLLKHHDEDENSVISAYPSSDFENGNGVSIGFEDENST